jgi:hypothetical protein
MEVMQEQIFIKIVLTTDKEDKYRQITTGLEIARSKPPNRAYDYERGTEYTAYFSDIQLAMKYEDDLLKRIVAHEQKRLSGV